MGAELRAVEMTGTVDEQQHLVLDGPIPIAGPSRVRIIILVEQDSEIDEHEWLDAASRNPAYDFLKDPREDIYTINDGKPFQNEG